MFYVGKNFCIYSNSKNFLHYSRNKMDNMTFKWENYLYRNNIGKGELDGKISY